MPVAQPGFGGVLDWDRRLLLADAEPLRFRRRLFLCSGYIAGEWVEASSATTAQSQSSAERLLTLTSQRIRSRLAGIDGSFAFVIYCCATETLFLGTDQFGLHAMFYAQRGSKIFFSTQLDHVIARLGAEGEELNLFAYCASSLQLGPGNHSITPFRGVFRVHRGEMIAISKDGTRVSYPWSPATRRPQKFHQLSDAVDALDQLVLEAVRSSISPEEGRVLAHLSGGLDSTMVALAAKRAGRDIQTLTWTSPEPDGGDTEYSAKAASSLQLLGYRIPLDHTCRQGINKYVFRAEPGLELAPGLHAVYSDVMERSGARCVVTGMGGDIVFLGETMRQLWLSDVLARGEICSALRLVRNGRGERDVLRTPMAMIWHYMVMPYIRWLGNNALADEPDSECPSWIAAGLRRQIEKTKSENRKQDRVGTSPWIGYFWDELRRHAAALSCSDYLLEGLNFRHPLFSFPLAEFMATSVGLWEGSLQNDRRLQRELLSRHVPQIAFRRSKGTVIGQYVSNVIANVETFREVALGTRIVDAGLVNREGWIEAIERARFGRFESLRYFDFLLKLDLWLACIERSKPLAPTCSSIHSLLAD